MLVSGAVLSAGVGDGVLDGDGGEGTRGVRGVGVAARTVARTRTEVSVVGAGRTSGVSAAVVGAGGEGVGGFGWCRRPPRDGEVVRVGATSAGSVDPDV